MKNIVYIDGIFDLFHRGHLESFKKAKSLFTDTYLIVGIISDKNATHYKRIPVIPEIDRYEIIRNIKIVDKVIEDSPLIMDNEFINKHKIDLIVHGFRNNEDYLNQKDFFELPIKLNKFKKIPYYSKESTTKIINRIMLNYYL